MSERNGNEIESRRILDRVGLESEARMQKGDSGSDAGEDWAEFWGRRIGRVLSMVLLFVGIIWIFQMMAEAG